MLVLQRRLHIAFAQALSLVILIGGVSFYYLHMLNKELGSQIKYNMDVVQSADLAESDAEFLRVEFYKQEAQMHYLLDRAQRNLILVLLLVAGGGLFLAFATPVRVVWPFKRLFAAFREAEGGNLSVRLPVRGEGEVAEVANSFNRLMTQLDELDEMKAKKIRFIHRRFETLANVIDAAVILINVEGAVIFLNAPAYRVFGLTSGQIAGKPFESLPLPADLKKLLEKIIDQKDRIEDHEWSLQVEEDAKPLKVTLDVFPITRHEGEVVNMLLVLEERKTSPDKRVFRRLS